MHLYKKFELNQTKIKGGCQSGRKRWSGVYFGLYALGQNIKVYMFEFGHPVGFYVQSTALTKKVLQFLFCCLFLGIHSSSQCSRD